MAAAEVAKAFKRWKNKMYICEMEIMLVAACHDGFK